MIKTLKLLLPATLLFFVFSISISTSMALSPFDIEFPIAELGNCGSMEECKTHCDNPANSEACFVWAKANGFVEEYQGSQGSHEDDEFDKKVKGLLESNSGPGGCDSFEECDAYCRAPNHGDECFAFARDNGLIESKELKRIEHEREKKDGPGGCRSRNECDAFCRNPQNTDVCLTFSVKEGFMTQEEADFLKDAWEDHDDFRNDRRLGGSGEFTPPRGPRGHVPDEPNIDKKKVIALLEEIGGPGGCSTFDECEVFCSTSENDDVCMAFAIEHELMSSEEIGRMKKMMNMVGPGGCRGRECEAYCDGEEHDEECFNFAVENDLIPPEEAEHIKKRMNVIGPGGCRGRECEEYCQDPSRGEECLNFAIESGMVSPERAEKMRRAQKMMREMEQRKPQFDDHGEGRGFGHPPGFDDSSSGGDFRPPSGFEGDSGDFFNPNDFQGRRGDFDRPDFGREGEGFPSPNDFPGAQGDFPPPGEFPKPTDFPPYENFQDQFPPRDEGGVEGGSFEGGGTDFNQQYDQQFQQQFDQQRQQQFDRQYEDQYKQQYDQQFQQQFDQQYQQQFDQQQQLDQNFGGEPFPTEPMHIESFPTEPFPTEPLPPTSLNNQSLVGLLLSPFLEIFR